MMTFNELNLNASLLKALSDLAFTHPTPIQEKAFPVIMSGRDVVGIAQTGTGKTLAYLLPCLRQWRFSRDRFPQILIIVPTRELVAQVVAEVEKLTAYMTVVTAGFHGGVNIKNQMEAAYDGLDVVVATPGRLLDLVFKGGLKLKNIKKLVIDEVDEMLNLGFRPQLTRILDVLPAKRQNLLFSATITEEVETLIATFFNAPEMIEAAPAGTPLEQIVQRGYRVPNFYTKKNLLEYLLAHDPEMSKVLVFTATKKLADQLYEELEDKFSGQLGVIHSNKDQNNRFKTVQQFHAGQYRILIATDIVARGIDISEVTHVVNFDIPAVPENYIHRIGRTGRADKEGKSITFITEKDRDYQADIETLMNYQIPIETLPADLEISDILTEDELPKFKMKSIPVKRPNKDQAGPAFHEKKEKNKKVNKKIRRAQKMKMKYKKPKTRGQKRK
jgi:ATP-dependent RNA helicase RhlE